ncbi:hypothetical protein JIQ42_06291 [Leishmania sp. Namibia]|uniref:hypothetical protein n=1 Tax=Leishmania sp. Namibia TaxID=2802991 RepID=UPI001B485F26|nr:hypothetical protein JIQ42_06291 [Leishmania sp. Namibia]
MTANLVMKQINVETATREQLVDFIRHMHPQLQREQERARELESKISGLQAFIHEKNAEIRELRQQSDRLTEKSASDEETIRTLIKQLEGAGSEPSPSPSPVPLSATTVVQRGRAVEHGKGKSHSPADAAGIEYTPEMLRPLDMAGNGDVGRRASRTPTLKINTESSLTQLKSQNAVPAITSKTEEVTILEKKIQELREVNAFYSAIVSQHDQEEKVRMSQSLAGRSEDPGDEVAGLRQEVERLQLHLSSMYDQGEKLQRIIKAVECEKASLMEENEALKRESILLEAEMEEMAREYERARKSLVAAAAAAMRPSASLERALEFTEEVPQIRAASAPQHTLTRESPSRAPTATVDPYSQQPDRRFSYLSPGPAPRMSPLALDGRPSMIGGLASSAPTASTIATARSHSRFTFRSLRPMRVRNPDAHERELLDRIRLYEEQFAQMEAFEADRQRSFDEMERNRAELFVSMNSQIEKQRKEIHRLRKLHEEASLKSSVTARPSRDHSFASSPNREEEEERGSMRRHGLRSPVERCLTAVPASSQSLRCGDSVDGLDAADDTIASWGHERESAVCGNRHQWRGTSEASPASFDFLDELVWLEEGERLHISVEAVEKELGLFVGMHAATVRFFASALEAREAQLFRETTDLMKVVDALQTRVVDLEEQLGSAREAERAALADVKGSESIAMVCAGDADSPGTNALNIGASLWEGKALHTAFMALKAYGIVLEYHTEFIKNCGLSSSGAEEAVVSEEDCMDAEIARDLEEVQMVLGAARCPAQSPPPLPQAGAPPLYDEPSGPRSVGELLTACRADPDACEDGAEVVGGSSKSQSFSHLAPPQPFSRHTQAQATLLSPHFDITTREEKLARGVGGILGQMDAHSFVMPDIFSQQQVAMQHPRNAFSSATDEAQETKRDGDSGSVVGPPRNDADQTAAAATEASSDDAVSLPLSTARGTADLPQFQDHLEEEHDHISTLASGDVDSSTAGSRRTPPKFEDERAASSNDDHSTSAKKKPTAEPISSIGVKTAAEPRQAGSSVAASADHDKEGDAQGKDQGSDSAEYANSVTHDNDTLSSNSQLEITEGEEADFLAQLEKEMLKGGLESAVVQDGDVHGTVASPGELDITSGGGEEHDAGCGESQSARSKVSATDASAAASVTESHCGTGEGQKGCRGDTSQGKEELVHADLEDELDDAASPVKVPVVKGGKSCVAPSLSPDSDHAAKKRSSSTSSTSAPSPSPEVDDIHVESDVVRDQPAPQIPVPGAGSPPPPLPPTSLETLFGGSVAVASSQSAVHNGDRQLFPASPASLPPPPFSDSSVSPSSAHLGNAIRSTTSPNSMVASCLQQTHLHPYLSWSSSAEQHLQSSGNCKGSHSHHSSSTDDFEVGFDPFA